MRRLATALVLLVALPAGVAGANPTVIVNGTFEADGTGSTSEAVDSEFITGWTVLNGIVDLGVTDIAGCPTVDTQDYSQLRDWDAEREPSYILVPVAEGSALARVESPFGTQVSVLGEPVFHDSSVRDDFDDNRGALYIAPEGVPVFWDSWLQSERDAFEALLPTLLPAPQDRGDDYPSPAFYDRLNYTTVLVDMVAAEDGNGDLVLPVPGLEDEYDGSGGFVVDESFRDRSGTAILLFSDISNADDVVNDGLIAYDGYVARGPVVYSDVFSISSVPRTITLDWAALGNSDDYAVLGYLLDVDDCTQTEIIDASGGSAAWTTTSVTVEDAGSYRFVFVSGTFDRTFGGAAGALFLIDDIAQTAVFSEAGVEIELSAESGATVAGTPVQISGGGLKAASAYALTLAPGARTLASGTTTGAGGFLELIALPDDLTAGSYTLTLTGVAPDDSEVAAAVSFTVGGDGTFGAISDTPVVRRTEDPAPPSSPVPDPDGDLPVVTPPGSTSGSVDGVPAAPTPSVPTSGTAKYEVGVVQAEVRTGGAGTVTGPSSAPVLQVVRDRVATVGGGGMTPGGIVEVWMPLPGGGSRQVALLPVGEDGTFDGALPFTGELDGNGPLPIGERTIQLYGTDANGQLTVINIGIRVTQPGPLAPEPERAPGAPPTLTPGQSLATNAGIPTPVTVTPLPGERTTRVQGDGWLLEIDVPDGTVRDEAGNPIMEIVAGDDTEVRGTGFMPGTRAYVWIMSEPTFLGEVAVRSDGTFAGDLPVDVAPGQHTLQVAGVGTDGYVRAANLGVIVLAGDGTLRPNRVRAGEGTAPLLPLETGALALALAAGLVAADRTRRRGRTTTG